MSSEFNIPITLPLLNLMPLLIASYIPLSFSIINFEIFFLFFLIIFCIFFLEPPSITICSKFLYDCFFRQLKTFSIYGLFKTGVIIEKNICFDFILYFIKKFFIIIIILISYFS